MSADGFTTQWAIRLPNGELMSYQPACTNAHSLTDPSEGLADEVDRWVERQGGEQ